MNKNTLIEKHLQNELSLEECLVFDKLLKDDEDFQKELNFQLNLKKAVLQVDQDNFRNLINDIESKSSSVVTKNPFKKWMAVASIVFILGLSYFLLPQQKISNDAIFSTYFEPYKNVVAPLVRGDNNKQDKKTLAFVAYEKGDYKVAISLFSELYKDTNKPFYLFYKANALLQLERAEEAIPLLISHLKTKDTLTQKTNWYLALAYLKTKDNNKAKEVLKKIINNGSYHNIEAKELLKKIN